MKRILSLTTVAAIMALMLVVMAPAALAVTQSSPSWDATSGNEQVSNPAKSSYAPGTQDNAGEGTASATSPIGFSSNCR